MTQPNMILRQKDLNHIFQKFEIMLSLKFVFLEIEKGTERYFSFINEDTIRQVLMSQK